MSTEMFIRIFKFMKENRLLRITDEQINWLEYISKNLPYPRESFIDKTNCYYTLYTIGYIGPIVPIRLIYEHLKEQDGQYKKNY